MKRIISAAQYSSADSMERKAQKILKASQDLLDMLEDTPDGFLENNDLGDLYDELIETIPAFAMIVRSKSLEY